MNDPEIIALSQTSHDITSTWNLKHDTNEHIYETEARPGPQTDAEAATARGSQGSSQQYSV